MCSESEGIDVVDQYFPKRDASDPIRAKAIIRFSNCRRRAGGCGGGAAVGAALSWDALPEALLADCVQLVKASLIEGNKKDNLIVIYTPASNLKKTGDMAVVSKRDKNVCPSPPPSSLFLVSKLKIHVAKRENAIVSRLNKAKLKKSASASNYAVPPKSSHTGTERS
ncbi:hypothetical protein DFH11DRAFT_1742457 [Phellopilus nigrolimitatus]|nr:hypothetical protein DFH11DRAFT_1742457 [Phellopilus nigrolimitatus]